jgi:predicted NACHT family NTPase
MTKRSLKASPSGVEQAKKAFERKGWTQEYLAAEVGLQTRQSIWKFFSGRPIERYIFIDICKSLDLDWAEIAGLTGESLAETTESNPQATLNTGDIPPLVATVREALKESILKLNSTINLLETEHPVPLEDIYIEQRVHPLVRGQT